MRAKKKPKIAEPVTELVGPVDDAVVEQAVAEINRIIKTTVFKGALEVGEYVFASFFERDSALVSSKSHSKAATFRALSARCDSDLFVSKSWLHAAVAMAARRHDLPESASYRQLPASHQQTLLVVHDPDVCERLSKQAADEDLSVRDLKVLVEAAVAKKRPEQPSRGRPKKAAITRTLDRATKVFKANNSKLTFTKAMLDELDDDGAKQALKDATLLIERLKALVGQLKEGRKRTAAKG